MTELNEGIYQSSREAESVPEEFEQTRANLALAMDTADHRRLRLAGSYGSIGAGGTWVEMDTEDGAVVVVDPDSATPDADDEMLYGDALGLIEVEGEVARDDLQALAGPVWDGHNHIEFVPYRAEAYCEEADEETYPWGTVTYEHQEDSSEGGWRMIAGGKVREDWVELGWHDAGGYNQGNDGPLTRDEFEAMWEDVPEGVESFSDDPNEARGLFCRAEDVDRIMVSVRQEA